MGVLGVSQGGSSGKELTCQCRRDRRGLGSIPGQEDSLEEGMATHSSILAWRIPWTVTIIEINCTINEIRLNHPETIIPLGSVEKIVFHEPGPQCQKGWGPLYQDV